MNVLLVQPAFPIPNKSKNHCQFLPIGLLKLASYHRQKGDKVHLVNGNKRIPRFVPKEIKISSLFTYWADYVKDSVQFYKAAYPEAKTIVGGIYASLMPKHCKEYTGCDQIFRGVHPEVEKHKPAYDLVDVDYQIMHTSRGCVRRCKFCGTWKVEPKFTFKESIKDEICSNRIIFYDNNVLANPKIENILKELANAKHNGCVVYSECQCGLDGRLLTPKLTRLIKEARFVNPRIAWDGTYQKHKQIKRQLGLLFEAGYNPKDTYVFMIYNFDIPYSEMVKKLKRCRQWGVQIADCRYRPLNQTFDHYNSHIKKQTSKDYYIHPNWTDSQIRRFRRGVREQNICIRHGFKKYDKDLERKNH